MQICHEIVDIGVKYVEDGTITFIFSTCLVFNILIVNELCGKCT